MKPYHLLLMAFLWIVLWAWIVTPRQEPYHQGKFTDPWQHWGENIRINVSYAKHYGYADSEGVMQEARIGGIEYRRPMMYYGIPLLNQWVPADSILPKIE